MERLDAPQRGPPVARKPVQRPGAGQHPALGRVELRPPQEIGKRRERPLPARGEHRLQRRAAAAVHGLPWAEGQYHFLRVHGDGVCEVPVGPIHAGIIEPGHFRFSVVGDTVLHLELRHFYTHKGTEKLFENSAVMDGVMIAESVSGDNCFSHAVAYCQAIENAFAIPVPPRAQAIRLVGLELERMLAHIADVGALCGDVGFMVPAAYTARIKETLLQASTRFFGTRYWRGIAVPGGVTRDLSSAEAAELGQTVTTAARDFAQMARLILHTSSLQNRFESTGILTAEIAKQLAIDRK